jgi:hypothetical protein
MRFKNLLDALSQGAPAPKTAEHYSIQLTLDDAARIRALSELHPGRTQERIIGDLLSAALDELEAAIPYVPGDKVIREDDFGDPVYEDTGLTPKLHELVRKHRRALQDGD